MNKLITAFLLITIFLVISNFAFSATIYVKHDASGSNNGTSWANAYTLFQSALNSANSGDQIWVAAGTYKPTSAYDLTNTPRFYHFRMKNGVEIYGGFAGTETLLSQRNISNNETILSGDIGIIGDNTDNCYHVFYHYGLALTSSAVLDGFTIRDGNANDSSVPHNNGGGIFSYQSSPYLSNNKFINNNANARGGALFNWFSNTIITHSTFYNNSSDVAGATMDEHGGTTISNCLFYNNSATSLGGAIVNLVANATITNSTITNNSAGGAGGIYNQGSDFVVSNCIIWGNNAPLSKQIRHAVSGTMTLNHTCYSNSSGDVNVYNSAVLISTNNNLTSFPKFVDYNGNDFRLYSNSPCVNSGNNTYNTETTDIRGEQRIQNTTIDMGAYEWTFGVDPECTNPTNGGTIATAQTICNNTIPAAFTNSTSPTGHAGTLEYKWQKSTTNAVAGFTDIASSNSATYTSGALTQTTWFKRLARVSCDTDWLGAAESNVIRVAILPTTVYVSVNYNSGTEGWGVSHFADVDDVLDLGCTGITVNISDNSFTGDLDLDGYTFIIGDEDFSVDGSISGGMIQTTGTGRLLQSAVQNTPRTFPVTDGTNNFTVTITPTSGSTSGMIGVKLNTGKEVEGTLVSPMTFFDIYGNPGLNATVVLRIDKAAISPATMQANTIMRFWNGTRYQPIPTDRVTISDQVDYYIITITNMNYFNEIPD